MSLPTVRSLLIVDDNPADVDFASIILNDSGRFEEVYSVSDGFEAIEMFRNYQTSRAENPKRFPPMVILLDINMPKMDGFEFLQAFADIQDSLPVEVDPSVVVMLTSSMEDEDREKASAFLSVKGYLVKPVTLKDANEIAERFGEPVSSR